MKRSASVESVKAVSDLLAPLAGEIAEVHTRLSEHPEWINEDPYGKRLDHRDQPGGPRSARRSHVRGRLPGAREGARREVSYVPHTPDELRAMLARVGVASQDELFASVPAGLRSRAELKLPPALDERALLRFTGSYAAENANVQTTPSFLGRRRATTTSSPPRSTRSPAAASS